MVRNRFLSKKIFCILLIGILLSLSMQIAKATDDLTITPNKMRFSGQKNDIITQMISVHNNLNSSISINVTTHGQGLVVVPATFNMNVNETKNVGLVFTMQNQSSGNITLIYSGNHTLNVNLVFDASSVLPIGNAPVNFFPSNPQAGSDLAIFFTGVYRGCNAKGFLYVNNILYPVDITNGLGMIKLDRAAYGTATLYLFGTNISDADSMKTFDIAQMATAMLLITVAKTATIDDDLTATVTLGTDPLGNQDIAIYDPSNQKQTYTTDNQGKIFFTVGTQGKWKLSSTNEGQTATSFIDVSYGVLSLGLADESNPQMDSTVTILTDANAVIDVLANGQAIGEYTATSDGQIQLPITQGGHYELDGHLGKLRGTYSFDVPGKANINIYDGLTMAPVQAVEQNKRYKVEIADATGAVMASVESVWIANPYGTKEYLPLTDGSAMWTPLSSGSYTITVDGTQTFAGNSRYLLIKQSGGDFYWLTIAAIILISFILIFIILMLYSKKRSIPLSILLGSLVHRQKRPELPL